MGRRDIKYKNAGGSDAELNHPLPTNHHCSDFLAADGKIWT